MTWFVEKVCTGKMYVQWFVMLCVNKEKYDGVQIQKLVFINFIIIAIPDLVNVFSFK